jgi:hypothetical protein
MALVATPIRLRPAGRTTLGLSGAAAVLSLVCFGLHGAMLLLDDGSMLAMIATMGLVSALCLGCSVLMLAGRCGRGEQTCMLVVSVVMIGAHVAFDVFSGHDGGSTAMTAMSMPAMPGMSADAGHPAAVALLMQVALVGAIAQAFLMTAALVAPRLARRSAIVSGEGKP